jgi:hypothetical protein
VLNLNSAPPLTVARLENSIVMLGEQLLDYQMRGRASVYVRLDLAFQSHQAPHLGDAM